MINSKRGADSPNRSGKKAKKKGQSMTARSGDYELDLNRFPDKMRWLLDNSVAPEALWWLPEGDAIGVNKSKFQDQLLVQEFRGNKFSSITRKLNRWGFRRVDDEERVPEGAIAYSHDFFLESSVSMMRFMKKEEDRKPNAEEDAKSSEEVKTPSFRNLIGESHIQSLELRQESSRFGFVGQVPPFGPAGFDLQPGLLHPTAPLTSTLLQRPLQANSASLFPANRHRHSLGSLATPQNPALPRTASAELSLRNQMALPMQNQQQQLLLQESHRELLLQDQQRQQQLRRLSGGSLMGTSLSIDPTQALWRQGSQRDKTFLQIPAPTAASLDPVQAVHLRSQLLGRMANLDSRRLSIASAATADSRRSSVAGAAAAAAAVGLQASDLACLDSSGSDINRLLLLRQQHEQIEQERLLQLRQQLAQSTSSVAALPQPSTATANPSANLTLSQEMLLLAQAERQKKEEEQKRGERK